MCDWTSWYDDENGGDVDILLPYETEDIHSVINAHPSMCRHGASEVECRIVDDPSTQFDEIVNQDVTCDVNSGLVCENYGPQGYFCYNYEMRLRCCHYEPCEDVIDTSPPVSTPPIFTNTKPAPSSSTTMTTTLEEETTQEEEMTTSGTSTLHPTTTLMPSSPQSTGTNCKTQETILEIRT